jgi:hypothetical protein
LTLLGKILPLYVTPEVPEDDTLSREETLARLRERGLPEELITYLRKAPEVLDDGEDPDPYHMRDVTPDGTTTK